MSELMKNLAGKFIVIDGPDGAGKTTQLDRLEKSLTSEGLEVQRAVDPGGTKTGHEIRNILLHSKGMDISPVCETFLFMASRAQLAYEVIRPALQAGQVVLGDRFISATLAYQGALGIDTKFILDLASKAVGETWPDLTIILDLDAQNGLKRVGQNRGRLKQKSDPSPGQLALFGNGDRMESRMHDYHELVCQKFRQLHEIYPRPVQCLNAVGSPEEVFERLLQLLETEFKND